jgi:tyrosine-specific transport protein
MGSKTFQAIAALVGTVIGAGIFGLPYVVAKIGFLPGIFYLLFLGSLVLVLNLIYGEVVLRTPGDHQLTGYAEIYLGKWGKILGTLAVFVSAYGALLAYLIKTGEFLNLIFGFPNAVIFSLLFFVLASLALYFGLRAVSFLEGLLVVLLLGLIFLLAILGRGEIRVFNFLGANFEFLFLPYGVILFALFGASVIPEMEEILRSEHQKLKRAIIIGSLVPLFVYLLLTMIIVGICGQRTSDDAISGLMGYLPVWVVDIGAILGVLTMSSSYLTLGYVLREVWFRDFGLPKLFAFFLASFPSLILFLMGAKNFIDVLGITGALMGGLEGVLIILIFLRAQKLGEREPAYSLRLSFGLLLILMLVFILGFFSPILK